jgi:hypothetical protein
MGLPHVGAEQPDASYYLSHKNVHTLGIADLSYMKPILHAYVYEEGTGKKGGNNVASIIMKHLSENGVLEPTKKGAKLTLLFDNCPGQNKNNIVLRLSNYIVERRYFKEVSCVFWMRGHTKNACDRMFNLLKMQYHRRNIYTFNQLMQTLAVQEDVRVVQVNEDDFVDYSKFLNEFYKKIKDGEVLKNHIFFVTGDAPNVLNIKEYRDSDVIIQQDLRKVRICRETMSLEDMHHAINRWRVGMLATNPDVLVPPGLPEMKQVELYCKWFEIVPLAYHSEVCPRPPDEMINRVKNVKNKKRQSKRKAAEITQESSQSQGADFTQESSQSEHDVDEREMDGHADMPDLSPIDEPEGLL